ncbi:MAG: single-stranded-DNA-specific exonuclease RecJ [Selenomonadaceae bacterium]|nr:single-stranded-DNA-specific exonuclease RecJ [Selenomonadaceae bacterium]
MQKKWIIKTDDPVKVSRLSKALGITELTAKILIHRGITRVEDAENFLNPENAPFNNPFDMLGMNTAVERIISAINDGEKICVYGDYDVDGVSASAIMIRALKRFGADVESYIPKRSEGYGLNIPALQKISESGTKLLISVDCGISNEKEISAVCENLDVIVTDHHLEALEKVVSAVVVIDPHQIGCNYSEKNLCGAGVAFKICQALAQKIDGTDFSDYTTDIELAALATVADLVPLTGENRKIVRMGLNAMPLTECIGLRELIKVSDLENKKISAGHIAFKIAPRLNAVGRLESASEGLKLLLTENFEEAKELAKKLDKTNQERKNIETEMLQKAEEKVLKIREDCAGILSSFIIAGENWNAGVIGLTASKLVEKYNLPTIILSVEGEFARGSCRSIPALHMKNALDSMAEIFEQYGGHSQAAGLSIKTEKIPELQKRFDEYVRKNLSDEDFLPILNVDALLHPAELTVADAEEFEKFKPCGMGNPRPILACQKIRGNSAKTVGKNRNHLNFVISSENDSSKNIRAVAWDKANFAAMIENEFFDISYEPEIDEWQNIVRVQCVVNYLEPTKENFPTRENLAEIYKFLKFLATKNNYFEICDIAKKFNSATGKNFSTYTILNAVDIFRELGLIHVNENENTFDIPKCNKKINLENSRTFRLGNNF